MASNKKTDEERARDREDSAERKASRRMGLAEVDLRWLYGTAPDGSSALGDVAGIRSSMGSQLDAARLGIASTRGVDVSASTDRIDGQIEARRRELCIRARLAQAGDNKADRARNQKILRLAFSGDPPRAGAGRHHGITLPGGFPALAVMTKTAQESWAAEVQRMAKRYVAGAPVGQAESDRRHREAMVDPSTSNLHKLRAMVMREASLVFRRQLDAVEREAKEVAERWLGDDLLLADHLVKLSPTQRGAILEEVDAMTHEALQAFALRLCWERRETNRANPLSARRCDRCGHHDPKRRESERQEGEERKAACRVLGVEAA